jgi:hypothetical protein
MEVSSLLEVEVKHGGRRRMQWNQARLVKLAVQNLEPGWCQIQLNIGHSQSKSLS